MSVVGPGQSALTTETGPITPRRSGWLLGLVFGVLASLLIMPSVRHTLLSQLEFAVAGESIPVVHTLDTRLSVRETRLLDAAAASAPDDYLLQVGRATVLAAVGGAKDTPPSQAPLSDEAVDVNDHSLFRLAEVARAFPASPGGYAHLARYMMVDRLHIQRAELSAPPPRKNRSSPQAASQPNPRTPLLTRTIPARHSDVRLMEWALNSGEQRDPDNAFWPALLAATYFAAERDEEAMAALARAARKPHWDAYLYEEVLGQWRLYSAAYGDNSATQKIGPLSLVAFPHLRELRRMAELVRRRAENEADSGNEAEAIRIRTSLAWLGLLMREKSQWAYEALVGTDLSLIASTDSHSRSISNTMLTVRQWESDAQGYLDLLNRLNRRFDIVWLHKEIEASCELRQRIDLARYDASYPGIPPGIPLPALFSSWMAGICLLQQMIALAALATLVMLWQGRLKRSDRLIARWRFVGLVTLCVLMGGSSALLFFGVPSPRIALVFLGSLTVVLTLALNALGRWRWQKRQKASVAKDTLTTETDTVEARWKLGTTVRMLVFLLVPGLLALYSLRSYLSGLHPVAILLTSLMDIRRVMTPGEAITQAILIGVLPIATTLALVGWALYRRLPPLPAVWIGLRRLTMPVLATLMLVYLLLLNGTLRLDISASRAINEAAQNDLQWILTHSPDSSASSSNTAP